jgi:hypothetical protein
VRKKRRMRPNATLPACLLAISISGCWSTLTLPPGIVLPQQVFELSGGRHWQVGELTVSRVRSSGHAFFRWVRWESTFEVAQPKRGMSWKVNCVARPAFTTKPFPTTEFSDPDLVCWTVESSSGLEVVMVVERGCDSGAVMTEEHRLDMQVVPDWAGFVIHDDNVVIAAVEPYGGGLWYADNLEPSEALAISMAAGALHLWARSFDDDGPDGGRQDARFRLCRAA